MALTTQQAATRPIGGWRSTTRPTYRSSLRYLTFGRAVPATVFALMGWLQVSRVPAALQHAASPVDAIRTALPTTVYALFCALPVAIYLTRPAPTARDGSLPARTAAFAGTCMQLIVGAFLPTGPLLLSMPTWVGWVGALMTAAAWTFAVYAMLHLRRSLSIIPEARTLVTSGPYGLCRHPLYLAEVAGAIGIAVTAPHLVPVAALGIFITLQIVRSGFEERLLARSFTAYTAYAAQTPRIIPRLRRHQPAKSPA